MSEYKDSKTSDTLRCTENFNVVGRVPLLYSFHLFWFMYRGISCI